MQRQTGHLFVCAALIALAAMLGATSAFADSRERDHDRRWSRECEQHHQGRGLGHDDDRPGERRGHEHHGDDDCDRAQWKRRHGSAAYPAEASAAPAPLPDLGIDAGRCDRERLGQLIGGAIGGVVGSQVGRGDARIGATIVGTVIGAILGGNVGRWMDEVDQGCVGQVLEKAPDQRTVTWDNRELGRHYAITPTYSFRDRDGRLCRDYRTTLTSGGDREEGFATACRRSDGVWEVLH